jgi:hypothetical protein
VDRPPSSTAAIIRAVPDPRREQISTAHHTWNDADRIAAHRAMTPSQRLALAIEARRAALRFANGRRVEAPQSKRLGP